MEQTKIESAIEATLNIGSGFLLSMLIWQLIANPMFGYDITIGENVALTSIFTVVSLTRSYLWRRGFNLWTRRKHESLLRQDRPIGADEDPLFLRSGSEGPRQAGRNSNQGEGVDRRA